MKRNLFLLIALFLSALSLNAENYTFSNSWGKQGFSITQSKSDVVQVIYSIQSYSADPMVINGTSVTRISLPDVFLFNDAGKPDLPGTGRYIAIPQGSTPHLTIVDYEVETINGLDLAWAPQIPLDTQKDIVYSKDEVVYHTNAFYPANPVQISGVDQIRGTDVVMLGITPFQYNPVTKVLKVYKNIKINLSFEGGSGTYGNEAFRSPYWDPIMADNILNFSSLPAVNYPARMQNLRNTRAPASDECEYIIISPNGAGFLSWADTLKNWRNQQGILTKVFSLTDVGGNTVSAIKSFITNAYNSWTIKPVACLLLGDYGSNADNNIISKLQPHDAGYPNFASDNFYADVTGDEMPDVVFARICANDTSQLHIMVGRIMDFERNRPTDTGYYNRPISALGWQDDRWFQLCSELVGGFWKHSLGKNVQRINALGSPANNYTNGPWSTASNTSTVLNYFGPNGLNYIPTNPGDVGGFTGGNATKINNAINAGSFILLHRDHGMYTGWGEPSYTSSNVQQLTNTQLPFVFSINCETGAFHNPSGCPTSCFQEVFQRLVKNGHNAGALGLVCPTETSYSFVNDAYLWGVFDNMWPQFMPSYGSTPTSRGILPAFGNAAGKYFLKQSNWPYNTGNKQITYRLFHMHGDAFLQLDDTVPVALTVNHPATIDPSTTVIDITANDSAFIALSVNNEIIATAYGSSAGPVSVTIPAQTDGTQILVVATKQDFLRYSSFIAVAAQALVADFSASNTAVCAGSPVNFTDLSTGAPTGWEWTFQGGNPATSTDQNPTGIVYATAGSYDVSLTISKTGQTPNTMTKTAYINPSEMPVADFTSSGLTTGLPTNFTDQSTHPGSTIVSWLWNFDDPASGSSNTSSQQNPSHLYAYAGTYCVSLVVQTSANCIDTTVICVNINWPVGISDISELGFEVYPNPTNGKFNIGFRTRSATNVNINVFNSLGVCLYSEKDLQVNGKLNKVLDFSGRSEGIYYIKIESEAGSIIRKLVIQK